MYYLNTKKTLDFFCEVKESEIYVDKSMMIDQISQRIKKMDKYICITRPRRFGKTVNAMMLAAYYTKGYDSKAVFSDLKISQSHISETHRNQHNVIYIDFSRMPDMCKSYDEYIKYVINNLTKDIEETYGLCGADYMSVADLLQATGDSFVFIMDEWDSIFYKAYMTNENKVEYLEFLKNILKDRTYVELAYMTGVLPIAKYSSGSALNMFWEFNFMNDMLFGSYFGFTEEEVHRLCENYTTVSFEKIKYWYNGYFLSDGQSLFNPRSVRYALTSGICQNYWTETGPMNEIADCIEGNISEVREDIVKMVSDIPIEVDLSGYCAMQSELNTRDEILSAMVIFGLLSYHDGYLRIPNHELMEKFQKVLAKKEIISIR